MFRGILVAGVSFVGGLYCFDLLFGCWYRFRNILLLPHNKMCICRTDLISFMYIFSLISLFWIDLKMPSINAKLWTKSFGVRSVKMMKMIFFQCFLEFFLLDAEQLHENDTDSGSTFTLGM